MENQKDDFTLKNYKRCIELSLKNSYKFITMNNFFSQENLNEHEKQIILRHDVDTQLDVAVKKAKIEKDLGVKSTYFIRLHSHSYNPLCLKDYNKIIKIIHYGHEIGLHYESDFYCYTSKEALYLLNKEVEILNDFFNINVKTICPHEPTRTNLFYLAGTSLNQAYDNNLLSKFKYISDSSCRWRDGSFYENIKEDHQKLYILTHPYWWYNQSPIEN